jgi:hypothetical protein
MPTECTPELFEFEGVERRAVVASFDGGTITSNAGALLLRQLDRGIGLVRRFGGCFVDRRDPRFVEHRVETLVGQRIFALALGYEDLNDHDELSHDPISPTTCRTAGSSSGLFSWFGRNRRIAKDYENLGLTLAAFVTLACIQIAVRRLAR